MATVYDTETGPGHRCTRLWQPFIFEFPQETSGYPEGTLLLVRNLAPQENTFTKFLTWHSTDHGRNWEPVGVWQEGGMNANGIWEPFLYLDGEGTLVAVFADERDSENHSQMLAQVVSHDGGDTWTSSAQSRAVFRRTGPGCPPLCVWTTASTS